MAKERGPVRAYLNTSNGAVRKSSTLLGFPFVEMTDEEADAANIGGRNGAPEATPAADEGGRPAKKAKGD